jgi:hypothetical protein
MKMNLTDPRIAEMAGIAGYDLVPKAKPKQAYVMATDASGKKARWDGTKFVEIK